MSEEVVLGSSPGAVMVGGEWNGGPVTVVVRDIADDERMTIAEVDTLGEDGIGASFELSVEEANQLISALLAIIHRHKGVMRPAPSQAD